MRSEVATIRVENGFFLACTIGWLIGAFLVVGLPGAFIAWLFDAYLAIGLFIGTPLLLVILCGIGIACEK